ncbi:RadC-like JAB domain-containing protein [Halanaerobium saccharolyticum]|jgi:DNA repair protein RadC|uniref:RadC-like JAB domain-containing protein n=1 Tax=Halanaerobium saccharolyticum TaxID=43595 RepID=A0A2T5RFD6_9FIRM|nr:JAB domain-containing protein [Halanaerobium saccharolyticum]PTV92989.1 RadC-like JAB domain-containing protein [Halanaerobium saccharolyticum]
MKSKKEVYSKFADLLQLNTEQQAKIYKLKLHEILNKKIISEKLDLSSVQQELYSDFMLVHRNLEGLYSIEETRTIFTPEDVLEILSPYMSSLKVEEMVTIYLNGKREVLDIKVIGIGGPKIVASSPSIILKEALNIGASGFILAHNHPGGSTEFSEPDMKVTELLETLGDYLEITLVDHLVYAENTVRSYAEEEIIQKL